jgi:CSLREA domain-containing protein
MSASRVLVAAFVALVAAFVTAASAGAKTYEVTKRSDHAPNGCKKKDCTLREAIIAANAHQGPDKVVLPKRKTYNLAIENSLPIGEDEAAEGDLDVTDDLTLRHPGKGRAKVDANGLDRVFALSAPATTLKKLVVTGGAADSFSGGGGILMVSDSDLLLARSVVKNNASEGDGGGIDGNDGVIVIRRSTITGNRAETVGGGIRFFSEAAKPSRVVKSTITGNRATGPVGHGGGILISAESVSIQNSTIARNAVSGMNGSGGGVAVDGGSLAITNSTIAENSSANAGGGIVSLSGDGVSANAITVARNAARHGGGLYNGNPVAPFEVENALIALNSATDSGPDCTDDGGPGSPFNIDSLGHNLIGDDSDCNDAFDAAGDIVNSNPKLGRLKNNGGPTQTVALRKGSPAINKADKQSAPNKDQRGEKRGKKPDIGAYERVRRKKRR